MITREKARALRRKIEQMAEDLPDAEVFDKAELFPMWRTGTEYKVGDRRQYHGRLYRCIQAHTSQDDWTPDVAVSLWVEIADPAIEYPEWVQPTGAHNAYMTGDKVSHLGKHWQSDYDANIWEPGVYGWSEVS